MKKRKIFIGVVLTSLSLLVFPHESNAYGEWARVDFGDGINTVDYFYSSNPVFIDMLQECLAPGGSRAFPKFSVQKANEIYRTW